MHFNHLQMLITKNSQELISIFESGGVFAYPTEAVYGLGCDPDNEAAVLKLLKVKQRPVSKGLILVAADFSQVEKYVKEITPAQLPFTKPSATTFIFPAKESAPKWITGDFDSIAIRISKHPLVKDLCESLNSTIVSTSANLSGQDPLKDSNLVVTVFDKIIDAVLIGELGNAEKPSTIRDSISGKTIRT